MATTYIVYDGRAADDTSTASVLECLDADNDESAMAQARRHFPNQGAWLYCYDRNGENLSNERQVGWVDDYKSFPPQRRQKSHR